MRTKHTDSWLGGLVPALILLVAILLILIEPAPAATLLVH